MRDKFKTKNGDLTHYALACGYVQQVEICDIYLRMWHDGGCCFHVSLFDYKNLKRIFWHSFNTLTEARKCFHLTRNNLLELSKLKQQPIFWTMQK